MKMLIMGAGDIGKALQELKSDSIMISRNELDLTYYEAVRAFFKKYEGNDIEVVVTAGYLTKYPFKEMPKHFINKIINDNFISVINVTKAFLKYCDSPRSKLMIISSSVYKGREEYAVYSAVKCGLISFVKSLNMEGYESYIGCIVPSRTDTKLRWKNYKKTKENKKNVLTPKEVAIYTMRSMKLKMQTLLIKKKNGIIMEEKIEL